MLRRDAEPGRPNEGVVHRGRVIRLGKVVDQRRFTTRAAGPPGSTNLTTGPGGSRAATQRNTSDEQA